MGDYEGYVLIVLGSLTVDTNNQPGFMMKVYGPFESLRDAEDKRKDIQRLEGGAVFVRPLVDYWDTVRRISAD